MIRGSSFLIFLQPYHLHLREDDVAETVPSLAVWEDGYRRSEDEIPVDPEDNNNSTQEDNEVIKWITDNIGTIEKEIQKIQRNEYGVY